MLDWAKRLGLALVLALLGGMGLWILGALILILVRWLDVVVPVEYMAPLFVVLFIVLAIGDWVYDSYQKRDKRDIRDL